MPTYKGIWYGPNANEKASDRGICRPWDANEKAIIKAWNRDVRLAEDMSLAATYGTTVRNIRKMRKSMFKKEGTIGGGPMTYTLNAKLTGCSCKWTGSIKNKRLVTYYL